MANPNIKPIPAENDLIFFPHNGTLARIMDGKSFGMNKHGEPITRLIIDAESTAFRYENGIENKELIDGRYVIFDCPTKYIIAQNIFSQTNSVFTIMVDFRRKHTEFTNFFYCHKCGKGYPNIFDSLRTADAVIKNKDIQIAELKEEIKELSQTLRIRLEEGIIEEMCETIASKILMRMKKEETTR